MPGSTAWSVGSKADQIAVLAAAGADPCGGQRARRADADACGRSPVVTAPSLLLSRLAVVVTGLSTLRNTVRRLLHLVHRADRDARVRLLERREVAADHDPLLGAGVAELLPAGRCRRRGSCPASRLDLQPSSSSALTVNARTRCCARALLRCASDRERRDRGGDAEDADVVGHLVARQRLDRGGLRRWRSRCASPAMPYAFENVRATRTFGVCIASGIAVSYDGSVT